MPRCGDGALARAIAQAATGMIVHATDASPANVASARASAEADGTLGRSVYIEQAMTDTLVYADNMIDLLVMAGLTDGELAGIPRGEIARVISPSRGCAIAGQAAPVSGLTRAALSNWCAQSGYPGVTWTIDDGPDGLWAVMRKGPLDGSDDWTHRSHYADGNPQSRDTALKWPYVTQWTGKPHYDLRYHSTHLIAGGRVIAIGLDSQYTFVTGFWARSAFNGQLLWRHELPTNIFAGVSPMVATSNAVYVLDGNTVLVIDPETGADTGRITFPGLAGQGKWLGIHRGIMVVLAGAQQGTEWAKAYGIGNQGKMVVWASGTQIAAYDIAAGTTCWMHTEAAPIDVRMFGVSDYSTDGAARVYFYSCTNRLAALDLFTGGLLWQNTNAADMAKLEEVEGWGGRIGTQRAFMATKDVLVMGLQGNSNTVVFSADDGRSLWSFTHGSYQGRTTQWLLNGTQLWFSGAAYDLKTGVKVRSMTFNGGGCGMYTAGPEMVYGMLGPCYDIAQSKPVVNGDFKPPCDLGTFIGGGIYYNTPSHCRCSQDSKGYCVYTSAATNFPFNKRVTDDECLERGEGDTLNVAPLNALGNDWPTYRGSYAREASSAATVATNPVVLWQYTPAVPYTYAPSRRTSPGQTKIEVDHQPTQPVAVGRYVFTGGSDGRVLCLDATSGTVVWSYWTGGRIHASPTVSEGRVFAGSNDGYLYAFEAVSGRLLWRFRAAPVERRIMSYGLFSSTWPVASGIVVTNGIVYAAAGLQSFNGTYAYALDAQTGHLVWQNNEAGIRSTPPARYGSTISGPMTVAGGRVWLMGGNRMATTCYGMTNGVLEPLPAKINAGLRGSDIGVFRGKYLIYGGRPFHSDHLERTYPGRDVLFTFARLNSEGKTMYPELCPLPEGALTPAWDDGVTVVASSYNTKLEGWSTPALDAALLAGYVTSSNFTYPSWMANRYMMTNQASFRLWGPLTKETSATALSPNALVAAYAVIPASPPSAPISGWRIALLDRGNGSTLWEANLPSEPVMNGLAITRDGDILVALRDGTLLAYGSTNLRVVTSSALPGPGAGVPYEVALHASHGALPYEWAVAAGELPAGLDLGSNGVISGVAMMMGSYEFTARVTDTAGASAEQQFTMVVIPEPGAALFALALATAARKRCAAHP